MNDAQRQRYSRQLRLPSFGDAGQEQLLAARVLVVGVGGLGSAAAMYLAAAGVGHLVLADYDQVDLSNLQRQIAHRTADIGRLKVESARDTLLALNPEIQVTPLARSLDGEELVREIKLANLVMDASDNFETRFALNRVCHQQATPLVSGAAMGLEGQVTLFPHQGDAPCYNCLYPDDGQPGETCSQLGVLAPLVGIIGALQANEAVKWLTGMGEPLVGRVWLLDGLAMEWRCLRLPRDPDCPTCGSVPTRAKP